MVVASGWVLVCSVYFAIIHFLYSDSIIPSYCKAKINVKKLGVDKIRVDKISSRQNGSRWNGSKSNNAGLQGSTLSGHCMTMG